MEKQYTIGEFAALNRISARMLVFVMLQAAACGVEAEQPNLTKQTEETTMEQYFFPAEDAVHEGTWLTWPHHFTYGKEYRDEIEQIWVQMAYALHEGEKVHMIAYNETEKQRIYTLLQSQKLDMSRVDFTIAKSDDVWARDTGPMFVLDKDGKTRIADFAFDGWGEKAPYKHDDRIPVSVAETKNYPILRIPDFVLEGGSVETDGEGTAMLCKSSVISKNRNPDFSLPQAEEYLSRYLGVTNFIWLEGVLDEDITDAHIDGIARFYNSNTLLTVSEQDFYELYEDIQPKDYETLISAKNAAGIRYNLVHLPLTAENVKGLDYKGSYLNYYVGNKVVLLPVYGDPNDALAAQILSERYIGRQVIPIDVTALYQYGGMIHCVTQQQP